MFADEGDELLIGDTEYIVLNKYTEDGKEYLFVANILDPNENIVDNFDSDAVKMLLLSRDELVKNSKGNEYILNNFLDSYISEDSFDNFEKIGEVEEVEEEEEYTIIGDSAQYFTNYHEEEEIEEPKTTGFFHVEKHFNFIERILEVMFL